MTRESHVPQEALPGMPEPFAPVRLTARNSLARALRPEYVGINPEQCLDITPEIADLARSEYLRPSLIDLPSGSEATAYFKGVSTERGVLIAVTPQEFGILSGSIAHLGERALNGSQAKRSRPNRSLSLVDQQASVRAGVHAVENRMEVMKNYRDNDLHTKIHLISKFQEAANHPGLARFGNEANMRQQFTYLREYVFGDIFSAIRSQRNWTDDKEATARRAVDALLFLDRDNNQHISNFKSMLQLAKEWNGYKNAIVRNRIWESETYIRHNQSRDAGKR